MKKKIKKTKRLGRPKGVKNKAPEKNKRGEVLGMIIEIMNKIPLDDRLWIFMKSIQDYYGNHL